jgi:hypothetical protein
MCLLGFPASEANSPVCRGRYWTGREFRTTTSESIPLSVLVSLSMSSFAVVTSSLFGYIPWDWGANSRLIRGDILDLKLGRGRWHILPSVMLTSLLQPYDVFCIVAVAPGQSLLASSGTHTTVTEKLCQTGFFYPVLDGGQLLLNGSWRWVLSAAICALACELATAKAMLDETDEQIPEQDLSEHNIYELGRIGSHRVIIACLPAGI